MPRLEFTVGHQHYRRQYLPGFEGDLLIGEPGRFAQGLEGRLVAIVGVEFAGRLADLSQVLIRVLGRDR